MLREMHLAHFDAADTRSVLPAAPEVLSWLQAKQHRQHLGHTPEPEQHKITQSALLIAAMTQSVHEIGKHIMQSVQYSGKLACMQ